MHNPQVKGENETRTSRGILGMDLSRELREQLPEDPEAAAAIMKDVKRILAMNAPPLALQIAIQAYGAKRSIELLMNML